MIVVSNTSPLCYLVLLGRAGILPELYGTIHTSQTVLAELRHSDAPLAVLEWAAHLPDWIHIHADPSELDQSLASLHPGERTALRLAEQLRADVVLLDEAAARSIAGQRGLRVSGLLGVLRDAAQAGLLDLPETIDRLRQTNFRASPELLKSLLLPKQGNA
jgi:predicted nucleic acid-binding protein